jgi:uncharacterized protein
VSDPQAATLDFLGSGAAFGLPAGEIQRIDTHAAAVFLGGARALKLKRAVRYSFLDFSTLEQRHAALEAELRLNRRTAPQLYRRLVAVTREPDGSLALGGEGEAVEWLLEMARFDQDDLLDRVARRGELDARLIERLADEIVALHAIAERRPDRGGHPGLAEVVRGNAGDLGSLVGEVLDAEAVERLCARTAAELERRRDILEARREQGWVRHCHGDLHLGNIVLIDGEPVLFDCLEFDEALACTDTLYDLAFLLMDLCHRGLRPEARLLLDHYLELDPDDGGLALLPLFLSVRAAIRAKVEGFTARTADNPEAAAEARRYLDEALAYLDPPAPRLLAIGGLSGSGKSTLARRLAPEVGPPPGAVVLRSDRLRKRLLGVPPERRLGPEGYREEVSTRVYALIARRAETLLRAGRGVIADAVFADPAHRRQIQAAAARAGAPFAGLWLDAPPDVLEHRVEARRGDASDATVAVVRQQQAIDLAAIDWPRLDAGGALEQVAARAAAALGLRPVKLGAD